MAAAIEKQLDLAAPSRTDRRLIDAYERRALTKRLAGLFDSLTEGAPYRTARGGLTHRKTGQAGG